MKDCLKIFLQFHDSPKTSHISEQSSLADIFFNYFLEVVQVSLPQK